ncbi:glycosyltransferase family 2 protein [Algoriphagus sp. Y33]|uniref:glycosyltransferase family 2 protein n=1 Tax=Algoriphagus sp. Y33 TaxID=2772483 RepID=UPI00177D0929|nr:glycosyltransferase family 2 protein [Algoriphagus sp. Y33]
MIEILVVSMLFLSFYAYVGYGILLFFLVKIRGGEKEMYPGGYFPSVSLVIPCYNEGEMLRDKLRNTLALLYPKERLEIICICDGSDDGSQYIPLEFEGVITMHSPERKGKLAAMKRAVARASGEILVFCDANTVLNPEAVSKLVLPYRNSKVGAVSGEKSIISEKTSDASTGGEGMYWKYESFLKKYDSYFYTLVGAAGELMSCRKELFLELPDNTILDDFMLSMKIAEGGYRVKYVPEASASEYASANIKEETKRKIRIAAGGWQSMFRLRKAINPFHDPLLAFQYISHRVLRWAIIPFVLVALFGLNHFLAIYRASLIWTVLLGMQYAFYLFALIGNMLQDKRAPFKGFFLPYYFCVMNYCAIMGFFRWVRDEQPATWERAVRADETD